MIGRAVRNCSVFLFSVFFLISCGGGGSSNLPRSPLPDYTISGKAYIGNVNNATISLYPFIDGVRGNLITTTNTSEDGTYNLTTNNTNDTLLVCMTDGRYTEPYTGTTLSLIDTDELCASFVNTPSKDSNVSISYYSHIAYGLSQYRVSVNEKSPIQTANDTISAWVGFDIIKTLPSDVTLFVEGATLNEAYIAGFSNAAISVLSTTIKSTSLDIAVKAYHDIKYDGLLDGKDANGSYALISTKTYRHNTALNMLVVANSLKNSSNITSTMLVGIATQFNTRESLIFSDPIITFTLDKPNIVNITIKNGDALANVVDITVDVIDQRGISNVTFKITNADQNLQQIINNDGNLEKPTATLNTLDLIDALNYTITITAMNILNSTESVDITGIAINNSTTSFSRFSPPKPDLTVVPPLISLVRSTAAPISVQISDPLGIKSVELKIDNGIAIQPDPTSLAPLYIFKADTTAVTDGQYQFTFTATNQAGTTGTVTKESVTYIVDNTPPTIDLLMKEFWGAGTNTVTSSSSDSNGLTSTVTSWNNQSSTVVDTLPNNETSTDFIVDTIINEGLHAVTLTSFDKAGNKAVMVKDIYVDLTDPSIFILSQSDIALVNSFCFATIDAFDNTLLSSVEIDGQFRFANQNRLFLTAKVEPFLLANTSGTYTIRASAVDMAGNIGRARAILNYSCGAQECTCNI